VGTFSFLHATFPATSIKYFGKLSIERNPFSAQNQTLWSYRVYISPTRRHHQLLFK